MKCNLQNLIALPARVGIVFFLTIAGISCAAQPFTSDSSISRKIDVGPGCDARFIDQYIGKIENKSLSNGVDANVPPPTPFSLGELKITWTCLSSDDSRVGFHGVAMLNPYTKKWVLDWSRIIGGASTKREERWLYHWFRANYKIIPLNSINSSGYAIVDTTQTEVGSIPEKFDKNAQSSGPILLSFCLVRSSKALCGNGSLGPKQDGPNGNLTSYALKIIRSIEFVD